MKVKFQLVSKMTYLEYWKIINKMCASIHCGTYEYSKDRMNKEFDAISRLYYICQRADEENEYIKENL